MNPYPETYPVNTGEVTIQLDDGSTLDYCEYIDGQWQHNLPDNPDAELIDNAHVVGWVTRG